MNTRTLAALTLVLASAAGCGAKPGAASHPRPAPGTAMTIDEKSVSQVDSFCPYVSLDGPAMVCIDISSSGWIDAVLIDVGAGTRRNVKLVDVQGYDPCGGDEGVRTVRKEAFDEVNQELASRIYQPAQAVLTYDPNANEDGETPPPPAPFTKGAATVSIAMSDAGPSLELSSGGEVVEEVQARWSPMTVVALGETHVGVVSHHHIQVWDLAARAPSCASNPRCPSHYPLTRTYLAAICDGSFGDENEPYTMTINEDQESGALAQDDFVILADAFRAFTGEKLEDPGLNDLFYGAGAKAWLPAACFGRFPSMKTLSDDLTWERDLIGNGAAGKPIYGE